MKLSDVLTAQQLQQLADHIELERSTRTDYVWVAVLGDFTFTPNTDLTDRYERSGTESEVTTNDAAQLPCLRV